MTIMRWTTDDVASRDRFAYWREAVCQTFLNVSMDRQPERFAAEIHGRRFGPLRFASFSATAHDVVRERADIARAPDDHFLISLQRAGESHIAQGDHAITLEPGEIAILDGNRPFRVAFPRAVSRILALIPRAVLESRAPWLRAQSLHKVVLATPFLDLAGTHLQRFTEVETLTESEATLLTDNLCNLLALATARDAAGAIGASDQMSAILAYCRRNLTEPGLSPPAVARAFGISLRTIHLRFQATGQSFGEWLLANRLELARKVLSGPHPASRTIADIAFGCGFRDLSHFNRTFRARFGLTPGECRSRT
jgi:AraC family transcriptional activator of tynA and feaB